MGKDPKPQTAGSELMDSLLAEVARMPSVSPARPTSSSERFQFGRKLGEGGFGVVYEAYDRKREATVAVKTLRTSDPERIYRLNREFRALADISHPNLVTLHELCEEGGSWFLSMELVPGESLLEHVRPGGVLDEVRLRDAMRQLASCVAAIHRAGKLHGDIKPSNIRVTPEGRLVVFDLGLTADHVGAGDPTGSQDAGGGTPAFLSPEQAAGGSGGKASDWYAVGITLYQALTGVLPFKGNFLEILAAKQREEPRAAQEIAPGIPAPLADICARLLRILPADRPREHEILSVLCGETPLAVEPVAEAGSKPFVARKAELSELEAAYRVSRQGAPVAVHVSGRSGIGKTTLVREFLDSLRTRERTAVLLSGRCYEQATIPFKAIDGLMDALAKHLMRLPAPEVEALLPRDIATLARLFPALARVEAVARAPGRAVESTEPQEARRRAFLALKELLARMADRRPVVLHVDNAQWGDEDSGVVLSELLGPPDPPAVLFIATSRDDEPEESPFLRALRANGVRKIAVDPLSTADARTLVFALSESGARDAGWVDALVEESKGSPYYIEELVRSAAPAGALSLDALIHGRVESLPTNTRDLLEVVAAAGRPIEDRLALAAAGSAPGEVSALAILRAARLIRTSGAGEGDRIDVYHEQVRTTVLRRLSRPAMQARHLALAATLSKAGAAAQRLAEHYVAAGSNDEATTWSMRAGDEAALALAFEQAASHYQRALSLGVFPVDVRRDLEARLGGSLANAGHGAAAAAAFLRAADGAAPAESVDWKRRAAEQLLRSGYLDHGVEIAREVLRAVGPGLARWPGTALVMLLFRRGTILLRGLGFREREESHVRPADLLRIDTCWGIASGLALQDHIRGANLQAHHVLRALRAGEPFRVIRALSAEAAFLAQVGARKEKKVRRLLQVARDLSARSHHPETAARLLQMESGIEFYFGRWRRALSLADVAEEQCREQGRGMFWEQDATHLISHLSLLFLGEFEELARRLPARLREAQARGNLFSLAHLRAYGGLALLAQDRPADAERLAAEAEAVLPAGAYYMQHLWVVTGRLYCHLYAGNGAAATALMEEQWPRMSRSLLLSVQMTRVLALLGRGQAAMLASLSEPGSSGRIAIAKRCARGIERTGTRWGKPLAGLMRGAIAAREGRRQEAQAILARAARDADMAEMPSHAAVARRRQGELAGGEEGRALIAGANAWMAAHGVRNPDRFVQLIAPGFVPAG